MREGELSAQPVGRPVHFVDTLGESEGGRGPAAAA